MKCCIECFKDEHLRDTIKQYGSIGDCDFCSAKHIYVLDISTQNLLSDNLIGLVQSYEVSSHEKAKPLKDVLHEDWDIFNCEDKGVDFIQSLITELCSPVYDKNDDIFVKNVIMPQSINDNFIKDNGVVSGLSWNGFSESIKSKNRFHNNSFNSEVFALLLSLAVITYEKSKIFYRARITQNENGFIKKEMFAPPVPLRCAGRVNPEGIGILYLAEDDITALKEVRAYTYDYVTVGKFRATRNLRIIDLSKISSISPFLYEENIFGQILINREVMREIASEIAKPFRRSDSTLEYLSTQFISEFVKSRGYDGVVYKSTLNEGGRNLAIYDESIFECIDVRTVEIKKIDFDF